MLNQFASKVFNVWRMAAWLVVVPISLILKELKRCKVINRPLEFSVQVRQVGCDHQSWEC